MEIHKPAIATMSPQERKAVIDYIQKSVPDCIHKKTTLEALTFCDELLELLKSSKIDLHKLKKLLGFHSERQKQILGHH